MLTSPPEVYDHLLCLIGVVHQAVSFYTSFMYVDSSLLVKRQTTVVSSANVMSAGSHSYVSRVNNKGLRTHPCGVPVLTI